MKRTDAFGSIANLFTDGNPGTGTPATRMDASWANSTQEELAKAIEAAGLALDGLTTGAQLKEAAGVLWLSLAIANNQAATNLVGLLFDKTKEYGARITYHLYRKTDTGGSEVVEEGVLWVRYRPGADAWDTAVQSLFDDAGVVFSVTAGGQVQYASSNIAGANYVGELRVTNVQKIKK